MLTRTPEGLDSALTALSPDDRALLELSMLRGVSDGEIATLLRVDTREAERRRQQALQRLGASLGTLSTEEVERLFLPAEQDGSPAPSPVNGARANGHGAARSPWASVARRRLSPRTLLLALAGLAAIVVGALALSRGDKDAGPPSPPPALTSGRSVELGPVTADTGATGNARVEGSRLVLRVRDLPRGKGTYTLWLYDSVAEAVPVARFDLSSAKITLRLPADAARYRSLDLSLEPRDGNPNHGGDSILRAPLAALR